MRRRTFMEASAAALGAAVLPAPAPAGGAAPDRAGRPPNLLIILADDLGWGDLACQGAPDLRTPHLDRLAADGLRFDNAYANCPVCSPTRAALLSGRYPELVGVPGVIRTHRGDSWGCLVREARLLPALLKSAGYHTAIVGKWHLGLASPSLPNERGFDFFHGFLGDMMDDYWTHRRHGNNYMRRDAETLDPKGHATDLFSDWACEYLRGRKPGEPFCLYLAYNAPHDPIQPPAEWLEKVRARQPDLPEKRAKLVAFIEHMDDRIGRVLAALRDAGHADDTLVIFTSDNGGSVGVGARNGPWRAGKGTLYEGGLRVPMAARWPGRIAPGRRTGRVALSMDIFATVLAAAGVPAPPEMDGASFLPVLLGQDAPDPSRDLFFGRREGGNFKGGTIEAIRRGPWKLLRSRPGGPLELYDLQADPHEERDVAADQPDKVKELAAALEAQLARYAAVPWQPPA